MATSALRKQEDALGLMPFDVARLNPQPEPSRSGAAVIHARDEAILSEKAAHRLLKICKLIQVLPAAQGTAATSVLRSHNKARSLRTGGAKMKQLRPPAGAP